ncbi:MAG: DUF3124 domain-containing protein [Desulfarculaceae bacterium]|nr:DUF3124 domain-containing protein [Desulfarculaceae bacterium]
MSLKRAALVLLAALAALGAASPALAQGPQSGAIYAPLYQTAVIDHRNRTLELTATLYVRNPNPAVELQVESIVIHDGKGKQLKQLIPKVKILAPLATLHLLVPQLPSSVSAPSALVRWRGGEKAAPPLVEVLMMGTAGQQGISLTTNGTPLPAGP